MSEQEKREIAAMVAAILAGAHTPAPTKAKAKTRKAKTGGLTLERKGAKFIFTLVQAGIRGGTKDKYSVRIERDGQAHTRGVKTPAGVSVSEHFTAPRLDFLTGITKKYFVQA